MWAHACLHHHQTVSKSLWSSSYTRTHGHVNSFYIHEQIHHWSHDLPKAHSWADFLRNYWGACAMSWRRHEGNVLPGPFALFSGGTRQTRRKSQAACRSTRLTAYPLSVSPFISRRSPVFGLHMRTHTHTLASLPSVSNWTHLQSLHKTLNICVLLSFQP